jgi:uncharacterized protein with HEPN domain
MKSNEVFLKHVLDEIDFLLDHTRALSFDEFMRDAVLQRACARSFEIMGEAVKNISVDFTGEDNTEGISSHRIFFLRSNASNYFLRCSNTSFTNLLIGAWSIHSARSTDG